MEGYQDQNVTSLRGTYVLQNFNKMIKIPLIGDIVIPKGEGLLVLVLN